MIYKKEMTLGGRNLSIETGKLAKQANGSVIVQYEDTIVLAAAVAAKKPLKDVDFFPLSVEYREKAYAAGKIPGGYFKREGRPSENEVLSARIIDRPLRPLFPDNFKNEVQIMVFVLSADRENDPDVLGVIGASAALSISDIPFLGPMSAVRVGKINSEFIINPTYNEIEDSNIDLVIAGTEDSIVMVEGESQEISEDEMIAALDFGHQHIKQICALQNELIAEISKPKMEIIVEQLDENLLNQVHQIAEPRLQEIITIQEKSERSTAFSELVDLAHPYCVTPFPGSRDYHDAVANGNIVNWDINAYDSLSFVRDWFQRMSIAQAQKAYEEAFARFFTLKHTMGGYSGLRWRTFKVNTYGRALVEFGRLAGGRPFHYMMDGLPRRAQVWRPKNSFKGFELTPEDLEKKEDFLFSLWRQYGSGQS